MKKFLFNIALLLFVFASSAYAENSKSPFQLNGIKQVSVNLKSNAQMDPGFSTKLATEVKLKLKSAGLEILPSNNSKGGAIIIDIITFRGFSGRRAVVQFLLAEEVKLKRLKNNKAGAITYIDREVFKESDFEGAVYSSVMDKLLMRFISLYMEQNEG